MIYPNAGAFKFEIFDDFNLAFKDYSDCLSSPFSIQRTGTEQLNTAIVELIGTTIKDPFKPFTKAILSGSHYAIANDTVTTVYGRNLWNHEITLIDETKTLERELMEAKSFTQPLPAPDPKPETPKAIFFYSGSGEATEEAIEGKTFLSPIDSANLLLFTLKQVSPRFCANPSQITQLSVSVYFDYYTPIFPWLPEYDKAVPVSTEPLDSGCEQVPTPVEISEDGIYTVVYKFHWVEGDIGPFNQLAIPIYRRAEKGSKKPYTVKDVVEQVLEVAKPLYKLTDTPKYQLQILPSQQELFAQEAPELHFDNGRSLLENLSIIGKYIHAIPRLSPDGTNRIYFEDLGSNLRADLSRGEQISEIETYNAEDYASTIESNFANLINAEDETDGSVVEPFTAGFVSLRSNNARIKEGDSQIETAFPIAKIRYVRCEIYKEDGTLRDKFDITKYIFEKSQYDLLSGFSGLYPYSKTYALYYETGGKTIDGLWYRIEDEGNSILNSFKKYAITNIIEKETGFDIEDKPELGNIIRMAFSISYVPLINGRARQERTEYFGDEPIVLAYNQSANKLSAKAFGENLRGQIAKLGTSSKTKVYLFRSLNDIPRCGTVNEEGDYISLETIKVYPAYCLCQFNLSTNYNEIGDYAELKTGIRQYEIPEGRERLTLLEEYCSVDDAIQYDDSVICREPLKRLTIAAFGAVSSYRDISTAIVNTYNDGLNSVAGELALPVYSTALGNSVYFGFRMTDNYTAGKRSNAVTGKLYRGTEYARYGDSRYSQAKYLGFRLCYSLSKKSEAIKDYDVANSLPSTELLNVADAETLIGTVGNNLLVWDKDSADSGNVAVQLHFVTNSGFILGSDLTKIMPYIKNKTDSTPTSAKVYFYGRRINQITGDEGFRNPIVGTSEIKLTNTGFEILTKPTRPFAAWAIKKEGTGCLIGKNSGEIPDTIYFTFKRRRKNAIVL